MSDIFEPKTLEMYWITNFSFEKQMKNYSEMFLLDLSLLHNGYFSFLPIGKTIRLRIHANGKILERRSKREYFVELYFDSPNCSSKSLILKLFETSKRFNFQFQP
jgi:hypothetical protein